MELVSPNEAPVLLLADNSGSVAGAVGGEAESEGTRDDVNRDGGAGLSVVGKGEGSGSGRGGGRQDGSDLRGGSVIQGGGGSDSADCYGDAGLVQRRWAGRARRWTARRERLMY